MLQDSYKHMDRRVKPACRLRKEECLDAKCQEVEMLERVDFRLMAEKIREITEKKRTKRSTVIKDNMLETCTKMGIEE